jgi:NAD(P)-dependent dehydrogenase (short-subunit alcohol dehydrogenase family)
MTPPQGGAERGRPAAALRGLVCLITGASGTLGTAIARRMRREGAELLLVGRSPERLAKLARTLAAEDGSTGGLELVTVDLAAADAAERVALAVGRRGRLDVLVNNAAIQGPIGPLWENDWAAWEETIRVDLMAPAALCRALVGFLAQARRGKIINISGGGASGPRANFSAYAVAKTGLVRFTETFAEEVRARNIDVNAVAPGSLASEMTERILAAGVARSGEKEIAAAERAKAGEMPAALDKAAALSVWLASAASDGISGRLLAALWDPWATLDGRAVELAGSDIYTLRRIVPQDRGKRWEPS